MSIFKNSLYGILLGAIVLVVLVQIAFYLKLSLHHISDSEREQLQSFQRAGRLHSKVLAPDTTTTMSCENEADGPCCSIWDEKNDHWWIHHPDWEVSHEDDESFCFSRIKDERKAVFYRQVYENQWKHSTKGCSEAIQTQQSQAGWAACVNQILYGFWSAYQQGVPFQITKHRQEMEWMFAPKNESSWAYCSTKDMNCYFLPLSDCPPVIGAEQKYKAMKPSGKDDNRLFQWLRLYATRPQQHVRKAVYDFITKVQEMPPLPWDINCTAMHVRRGDSGFVKFPWRRYAAVQGKSMACYKRIISYRFGMCIF